MQPSSLVFLVIIAIWAAYLLQHWVRRREHLATARSVDRFSDAMHVLERRTSLPEPELPEQRPRSYAVSPARPARQEVVVKRDQSPAPNTPTGPVAGVQLTRIFHILAGLSARRVRGLSLVTSLSLMVVVALLAVFSVLPWWSVPVAVAIVAADVAWLRHVAVRDLLADQDDEFEDDDDAGAGRSATRYGAESGVESEPGAEDQSVVEVESVVEDESQPAVEPEREPVVPAPVAEVAEPPELPAWVDPAGWSPVPVPPPTYTLKAKADPHPPFKMPAAGTESTSEQSLSLAGLVYDYDLDELVERRHDDGPETSARAV